MLTFIAENASDLLRQAAISAAASEAERSLMQRYDFYWAVASAVATIMVVGLTFLGFGAWKNVRAGIKSEVTSEIKAELLGSDAFKRELVDAARSGVAADFEKKSDRLERQIQLSKLQYLSEKVRQADSFSNAERDGLYNQLVSLRDDTEIVKDIDYLNSLEQVLDSFYGASLWSRLDDLDDILGHIMRDTPGMVQTMAMSYALRVFGEIDEDSATLARLKIYIQCLDDFNMPWLSIPLKVSLELMTEKNRVRVENLCEDFSDLDPSDLHKAMILFNQFTNPERLSKSPKHWHGRVCSKFSEAMKILVPEPDEHLPASDDADEIIAKIE